jgi:CRP/FNR family transcriptional regulator, dissimilatory nitrate respiration regulator
MAKTGISEKIITREMLISIPLFSELSDEQLEEIISIGHIVEFRKNSIIFNQGDIYKGFYILINGAIKVYTLSAEGKESIMHLIKPGDTFGDIPLFEGGNYPVNSQNITNTTVIFFSKNDFLNLLSANNRISLNMLAGFAKRLRALTHKIEELTSQEVMNRFAYYLIDEIKKAGADKMSEPVLKLNVSKKNIAAYIGTITETFSRVLKKMQDEKIIRVSGKTITVIDYPRLNTLANQ